MSQTFCYIAREEGIPGAHAVCVDMPDHKKDTAQFVREEITAGFIVERIPLEQAKGMLREYYTWKKELIK